MRIGLFSDTYRPSINGVVYVIDITKRQLEALGHEVVIFCPADGVRNQVDEDEKRNIIRFPSVKGAFYDDYNFSFFFPPWTLRKIKELKLDVVHVFTPGQIGVLGISAAHKTGATLVMQHSTDIYEYTRHYPMVLPGLLMLIPLIPFALKFRGKDINEIIKLYVPRRGVTRWNQDIVEAMVTMVYSRCDVVIALSRKSKTQLESWMDEETYHYPIDLLPTGVNALPRASEDSLSTFRKKWNINSDDELITYVGRLGAEKNLDSLIPMFEKIIKKRPNARLLYVGDFEYRKTLEGKAAASPAGSRITFTGALPRDSLGTIYAATNVFVFPSLTDTQGLVLHEAAYAGCPLVVIDKDVSEVIQDNVNGFYALNSPRDMANKVLNILKDKKKQQEFSLASKKLAAKYTEEIQTKKLVALYERAIANHSGKRVSSMKKLYRRMLRVRKAVIAKLNEEIEI